MISISAARSGARSSLGVASVGPRPPSPAGAVTAGALPLEQLATALGQRGRRQRGGQHHDGQRGQGDPEQAQHPGNRAHPTPPGEARGSNNLRALVLYRCSRRAHAPLRRFQAMLHSPSNQRGNMTSRTRVFMRLPLGLAILATFAACSTPPKPAPGSPGQVAVAPARSLGAREGAGRRRPADGPGRQGSDAGGLGRPLPGGAALGSGEGGGLPAGVHHRHRPARGRGDGHRRAVGGAQLRQHPGGPAERRPAHGSGRDAVLGAVGQPEHARTCRRWRRTGRRRSPPPRTRSPSTPSCSPGSPRCTPRRASAGPERRAAAAGAS